MSAQTTTCRLARRQCGAFAAHWRSSRSSKRTPTPALWDGRFCAALSVRAVTVALPSPASARSPAGVAQIVGPRSSRCRQRSTDRIAVSLKHISSEKNSIALPAAASLVANSLSIALDEFANLCAYRCPTKRRRTRRRSLRTETVLRLRSHIVAKAAAALPFIRPCDWSRMSATEQGPSYLTKPEYLGTSRIAGRA